MSSNTFLLLVLFIASQSVQAQWATNGNNINNTNTGNVGIGTTAPQAKLEVHHSSSTTDPANVTAADLAFAVRNTSNTNGNFSIISFIDSAGWGNGHIGAVQTDQAAHSADLFFSTRNAGTFAEKLRIKANGNVGIGTTNPTRPLEVLASNGEAARLYRNANNVGWGVNMVFAFNNSSGAKIDYAGLHGVIGTNTAGAEGGNLVFSTTTSGSLTEKMRIDPLGNVGIGATGPTYKLQVSGNGGTAGDSVLITDSNTTTTAVDIANTSSGAKKWRLQSVGSSVSGRVGNFELVQIESDLKALVVQPGGNVGVGTIAPSATLHVQGTGRFTGNLTVDGNIAAKYQDVAEWVPATRALPPGTVVTLSPTQSNLVEASSKAYDTRVAGVISEKPGLALGESGENKVLVATTGRVRIKVDATNAPIAIGDLLVTSEKEGVAMKSMPISVGGVEIHRPGTIVGKALEPLAKGQGEILVLLSLQ